MTSIDTALPVVGRHSRSLRASSRLLRNRSLALGRCCERGVITFITFVTLGRLARRMFTMFTLVEPPSGGSPGGGEVADAKARAREGARAGVDAGTDDLKEPDAQPSKSIPTLEES